MDFNEDLHKYKLDGENYVSVSDFIEKHKIPFEKEKMAERTAEKKGLSVEDVLLEWDLKGRLARNFGKAVHFSIEMWIKFGEKPKLDYFQDLVDKFAEKYDRKDLLSEIVVFDKKSKLAGRIDVLRKVKGGVEIIDIKTNSKISDKAYDNFISPLQDIPQSNLNEYRLQQSLYKYMVELRDIKVKKIKLEHWSDNFKTIKLEPIDVKKLL